MKGHLADETITYTGRELRSHWLLTTFGLRGDAIAAFLGPCDVPLGNMLDLADVQSGLAIRAALMLHLIAEHFDPDLERAILRQRLLVALAREGLDAARVSPQPRVARRGDDLFVAERKLSVSIATVSPVSTLLHLGINVDPAGAPVPAIGLQELGVEPKAFARGLMDAYAQELAGIAAARCKVRAVP